MTADSAIAAQFQQALGFHKQGKLQDAGRLYREILGRAPRHASALHLLGVIAYQHKEFAEAERLIGQALAINPDFPEALSNYGLVLLELQRPSEALSHFKASLAVKPGDPDALYNQGIAFHNLGRFEEALASYDAALAIKPGYIGALNNRGNVLAALQRWDEALASYDLSLKADPAQAGAYFERGNTLYKVGRMEDAVANFDRALTLNPNFPEALCNRATALLKLKRPEEALAGYDRAIALKPDFADALSNRVTALSDLKRSQEAVDSADRALALNPGNPDTHFNRGNALQELKRLDEAVASYDRSLALKPANADVLCNRAIALMGLRRLDEALAAFDRALVLEPAHAKVHWNESLCRLVKGDFRQGWQKYEWRWRTDPPVCPDRNFQRPLWLGDRDLAGKALLLHAEQGVGDTIQACRYIAQLIGRPARIILEVQPALKPLFASFRGVAQVLAAGEPLPDFDLHCPLMSLPFAFKTSLDTIPAPVPYIGVTPEFAAQWRTRVSPKTGLRVGVVWAGDPKHGNDHNRSMSVRFLEPLLKCGATLVSLQNSLRPGDFEWLAEHPQVIHVGEELRNFADTAAVISSLDMVITVDTAVAHLAGAMGKKTWVLLPYLGIDWRWLLDRDDSPWYPTARLFRQEAPDTWGAVIDKVAAELRRLQ